MNKTKIEWVKNPDGTQGYTWNPITGCLNGCSYCYARKLANGRLKARYRTNTNLAPTIINWGREEGLLYSSDPFYPRFWPSKLTQPWSLISSAKPKGIFCCDMSDLFGIGIPEDWTRQVLSHIKFCKEHRFYLLTKQPQNLIRFSPFPDNCWVGVSATDAESYYDAASNLAGIKTKVKYISFEPLLDVINGGECTEEYRLDSIEEINWVIIGSQTKPYNPPKIEWVKEIVDAADKAGIPVFLKNNLKPLLMDINQEYVRYDQMTWDGKTLRQEMS